MSRTPGDNLLTRNEDFTKIIPTRFPPKGVTTRRVSILEALAIAEEFYSTQRAHARNAEYCRARRARLMPAGACPITQKGEMKDEG